MTEGIVGEREEVREEEELWLRMKERQGEFEPRIMRESKERYEKEEKEGEKKEGKKTMIED